ncbi:MAG: hypothetical protein DWQ06_02290 [Calditrichaeota bacterium]|nr:MAG: hypothetical protein DWQ06_02290 [Calditrichota bacterium]
MITKFGVVLTTPIFSFSKTFGFKTKKFPSLKMRGEKYCALHNLKSSPFQGEDRKKFKRSVRDFVQVWLNKCQFLG